MTIAGTIKLNGIDEMLRRLPKEIAQAKVVEPALRKGAVLIRDAAHDNLVANGTVDSGLLAGTMQVARRDSRLAGVFEVVVKPSAKLAMVVRKGRTKESRARPSKYAHFVEYGTEHSRAEPFLRPALDEKGAEAGQVIERALEEAVVAAARRVGLKAG